ncbi:hypothetical protein [Coleofasciculus sp. LEGE 07092]|nr:hypothetical protein [Coleofasciculus sp. LEGE 07092]
MVADDYIDWENPALLLELEAIIVKAKILVGIERYSAADERNR